VARLDLARIGRLSFAAPDPARYPALGLAREVMAVRGLAGAVFNATKEAALDGFIAGRISFPAMAEVLAEVLARMSAGAGLGIATISLDNLMAADGEARRLAEAVIASARM
jgi:1-deoxy-D-xylulose-5-phosphate reductoisomerase